MSTDLRATLPPGALDAAAMTHMARLSRTPKTSVIRDVAMGWAYAPDMMPLPKQDEATLDLRAETACYLAGE